MQSGYSLFGQSLVDEGVITQQQLDEAVHKQQTTMGHRKVGEILARLGYISKVHVTEGLAKQLNIPIVDLSDREIPERIRSIIEGSIATLYRVIPIEERGDTVVIATSDPTNMNNLDNLTRLLERPVEPVIASSEDISEALNKYYGHKEQSVETMLSTVSSASSVSTLSSMSNISSLDSSLSSLGSLSESEISMSSLSMDSIDVGDIPAEAKGKSSSEDDDDGGEDSPVMKYVNQLIMEAFRLRASDIHVEPAKQEVKIRYRIDGVMQVMPLPPKRAQAAIISRLKIMSGMDIAERRVPQDGRIKMNMGNRPIDLRVNTLPASYGESVVMRILDQSSLNLGLGQLGFSPEVQTTWEEMLGMSTGVILVTGPTGSGKTTTLYASLNSLNTPDTKIITVEDPVEYQLHGINQVQIQHSIGFDFTRALRAIFRQDPNIVMVGEIRDVETAEIAIKAALTGHLVFSTLHTNDTASSFTRLIDVGIKNFLVASGVRAILAQRLLRTICTTCKDVAEEIPEIEFERLGWEVDPKSVELFAGKGCDSCGHSGHQGRLGAYELLVTSDPIRQLIMEAASDSMVKRQARLEGMHTMREDAWKKALNGITTIQEVNRRTRVDELLRDMEGNLVEHDIF